mgnify:CR=1 FL=1|uniref:Uncharacterized protein n=1 Tax=Archaeoglobus fulgidus TaxID=2234 RepID=A0A7C2NFR5_ARCFL
MNENKLLKKAAVYAGSAPLISYPGFEDLLNREEFLRTAREYRIKEAVNCVKDEIATEYEAFLYLHTASLATPFSTEWFRIYHYLFNKFYGDTAPPNLKFNGELTENEKRLLLGLRKWIFKKQISTARR